MRRRPTLWTAWRNALSVMAVLVIVGFGGCDADPMPSPGLINKLKVILSTSQVTRPGGPLDLIGIIGLKMAAPGTGIVVVHSPFNGSVESTVGADGTFASLLPGAAGDQLTITFKETEDGPESDPVTVSVPAVPMTATSGAADTPGTPSTGGANQSASSSITASAPDAQGQSEIKGTGLTAGQDVLIGNTRTGEVVESTVTTTGTVDEHITAMANDSVVVIVRDTTTGFTSGSATLSVPSM